jgi:HPr kinase/phosphorylase
MVSLLCTKVNGRNGRAGNDPQGLRRLSVSDEEHGMEAIRVQGVLVRVDGVGVFLRGPSGIGKSLTALKLLDRGHFFVSDDLVEIAVRSDGCLVGRALEESPRIEIRGMGIFHAEILFPGRTVRATALELEVELDRYRGSRDAGRLEPEVEEARYLGVTVPRVRLPVAAGLDPAVVVELLVRHLRHTGAVN